MAKRKFEIERSKIEANLKGNNPASLPESQIHLVLNPAVQSAAVVCSGSSSFSFALSNRSVLHSSELSKRNAGGTVQSCVRNKLLAPSSRSRAKYTCKFSRNHRGHVWWCANSPTDKALRAVSPTRVILADLLLCLFLKPTCSQNSTRIRASILVVSRSKDCQPIAEF